ncbi:hypothetical protein Sinac_1919 [Singulisphaera acidiphila DSM 18658]|uniref:Uncharacterized protein n=1 Tax=Singulisphaera acidiphila (strain ATCC BAA-1392 / DSM 18658 / VKM B-2454 / MOB10) TaxID=886293 RepID=L0DC85_SINAD|nr:hypothetical protein Sinac_1919 [Singulisphaera acidiphila DSM 18658]
MSHVRGVTHALGSPGGATVFSQGFHPWNRFIISVLCSPGGATVEIGQTHFTVALSGLQWNTDMSFPYFQGFHPWLLTVAPPGLR